MMKRSVVDIDYDRLGTERKNRVFRGHRFDEDEVALATNLYLVDAFKPLLRLRTY